LIKTDSGYLSKKIYKLFNQQLSVTDALRRK